MGRLIVIIIFLFPSIAFADEWNDTDTSLQVAYSVVHLVDWSQTLQIAEYADNYERCEKNNFGRYRNSTDCGSYQKDIVESNLVLGKRPSKSSVNKYFAGTLIGHYLISRWLKKPYRNIWQSVTIGLELGYIHHNIKNGFKVRFDF